MDKRESLEENESDEYPWIPIGLEGKFVFDLPLL
jgi:hypothetical protein